MKMKIKRIIIWGHCIINDTAGSHSWIHRGYYLAFKKLGYETHWIDDMSTVDQTDLSGTLFFSEGTVFCGMPIRSDCYYVLHHIDNNPFIQVGAKYVNLCNYLHVELNEGRNWNYPGSPIEKIKDYVYYDVSSKAIYQPWATDLLPDQIDDNLVEFNTNIKEINFIGSIWSENINEIVPFFADCYKRNIRLNIYGWFQFPQLTSQFTNIKHMAPCGTKEEVAIDLIKSSLIYPDVRGALHKKVGYIPCRSFKNISYGCIPCTNSLPVYQFFDNILPYSENSGEYIQKSIEYLTSKDNKEKSIYLMNKVKKHHTYINRASDLLDFIKVIYNDEK